jgi:hypothetical protein
MTKKKTKETPAPVEPTAQAEPQAAPAPKAAPKDENLTLERQRVVNAVVSDATLTLAKPEAATVAEVGGETFVRVRSLVEDVVAALGVTEEIVRRALESAVQQGLLEVPPSLPVSEHPITFVRPSTL